MFPWIIAIALLLVAVVLYVRTRMAGKGFVSGSSMAQMLRQPPRAVHKPAVARKDFRAVSIKCAPGSCHAARVLEGKRGFSDQIPRLPLSQCDAGECVCTYTQHRDRRATDDRRRLYATLAPGVKDASERRELFDRRIADLDEDMQDFNFSDS
ncbi:MAG: hypothetical protein KJP03_06940 [Gammaproteobacteria bacterium]|nr:hypothetical protein [Gammaproteobacteria bacterium]